MEYLTVKESAKSGFVRAVQQLCEQGRIPGIQKFGKSWAIPAEAEKPEGVRSRNGENTGSQASSSQESLLIDTENLMSLMNSPFQPGHCLEAIAAMPTGLKRDIAMAEYYYFSGQAEKGGAAGETISGPRGPGCPALCLLDLRLRQPVSG